MARTLNKLQGKKVENEKRPGIYGDGGGLYLQVGPDGGKSWIFRYRRLTPNAAGKFTNREMGLGPFPTVSLAKARELATRHRLQRLDGKDPIEERRADRARAILEAARNKTFRQCAVEYIEDHASTWTNSKHAAQWTATLGRYVYPKIGEVSVQQIDTPEIRDILRAIWSTKPETANRVRGRIESILDWATANKLREGPNPARWRGHLENMLPARSKVRTVKHHPALPYAEIGSFMAALKDQQGTAAKGLRFLILTAARTGEVIGARWSEIDPVSKVWIIPAERMKGGREHRVPLTQEALDILDSIKDRAPSFVFPGGKKDKPLSNMAFLELLRRMGRNDITAHGFRSSFRDWAAEQTSFPHEVAEMALAHAVGDKVEAAYRRGDMIEKRRKLMEAWAAYCGTVRGSDNVVQISTARTA